MKTSPRLTAPLSLSRRRDGGTAPRTPLLIKEKGWGEVLKMLWLWRLEEEL
jgi:hypothetical protein